MKYLMIENKGEVVTEAFTLIGASSKRDDDTKIGMFGSGNKYALAYFLRNKYQVRIFSGTRELEVGVQRREVFNQDLGVILIDGQPTSMTTEMGHKWDLWQAIREVYSNALDEGDATMQEVDDLAFQVAEELEPLDAIGQDLYHPEGREGYTRYYIPMDENIKRFLSEMHRYFVSEDTNFLYKNIRGRILPKDVGDMKLNLFRKGIRCLESDQSALFDYDLYDVSVNESRIATSESTVKAQVWQLWGECDLPSVIKELLQGISGDVWENNDYFNYWSNYKVKFSSAWGEALNGKWVCPADYGGYVKQGIRDNTYFVPMKLYKALVDHYGATISAIKMQSGEVDFELITPDGLTKNTLTKMSDFFEECGYQLDTPIVVVHVMGKAGKATRSFILDGTIYVSERLVEEGVQAMAVEVLRRHIIHKWEGVNGLSDTVNMATEMLNYMKRQNSINL